MAAATLQGPPSSDAGSPEPQAFPLKPTVIPPSMDALRDLEQYYPIEAKRMGREALVIVEVDMDAQGNATDARVAHIDPADVEWGFGPAAIAVAREAHFDNPAGRPTRFRMRVKFDLKH
jgi:TonB family protein